MSVIVKRRGAKFVATLPTGQWTLKNWRGRIIAFSPDHPPLILGEDGLKPMDLSSPNRKFILNLDRFGNVAG
jgi:hypothetical protein